MALSGRRLAALVAVGALVVVALVLFLGGKREGAATRDDSATAEAAAGTGAGASGGGADDNARGFAARVRRLERAAVDRPEARTIEGRKVVVTGVVRVMPAGTPAPGAEVAFLGSAGENTALADDQGRYQIEVAAGVSWTVHARTDKAVGPPTMFTLSADTLVRDLEVFPVGTIRGRVLDARGLPVGDAEVNVVVEGKSRGLLESAMALATTTEADGRYELQALPGAINVRAYKKYAQGVTHIAALAPAQQVDIDIRLLDPATLGGVVVDPEGRGLGGAKVTAWATLVTGATEKFQLAANPDGSFRVTVPAGGYRIEARYQGDVSRWVEGWNDSGGRTENLRLTVAPLTLVRGKVVKSDGKPAADAQIRLNQSSAFDATSDSEGSFSVHVPAGPEYIVKIRHPDGNLDTKIGDWGEEQTFVISSGTGP